MQSEIKVTIGLHAIQCRVIDYLEKQGRTLDLNCIHNIADDLMMQMITALFNEKKFKNYNLNLNVDTRFKKRYAEDFGDRRILELAFDKSFFDTQSVVAYRTIRDALEDWASLFLKEFLGSPDVAKRNDL